MPKPPAAPPTLRRPVRTVSFTLDAPGYEGVAVEMRSNPPLRVYTDLQSEDFDLRRRTLVDLIVRHGLVDDDGKPLAIDADGEALTGEEVVVLLSGYYAALTQQTEAPKASDAPSGTT